MIQWFFIAITYHCGDRYMLYNMLLPVIIQKMAIKSRLFLFSQSSSSRGSLILIDRTLDLVGPSGHSFDTLADIIIQLLPRLPQHSSDVAVDMSPLCSHGRYVCNWSIANKFSTYYVWQAYVPYFGECRRQSGLVVKVLNLSSGGLRTFKSSTLPLAGFVTRLRGIILYIDLYGFIPLSLEMMPTV